MRWLIRQLLDNAAGHFSVNKFHGELRAQGVSVGKDTLHAYLAHLEDAFLIRTLVMATDFERQRMVNPRKVYPIDSGLIPVFDRSGRANLGHALETSVLLQLYRRGAEVAYVRTPAGFEVDFLAQFPEGAQELIQVCSDLGEPAVFERESRALRDAAGVYPRAALQLIVLHPETVKEAPAGIAIHSAAAWLLEGDMTL